MDHGDAAARVVKLVEADQTFRAIDSRQHAAVTRLLSAPALGDVLVALSVVLGTIAVCFAAAKRT